MERDLEELMYELGTNDPIEALEMETEALEGLIRAYSKPELMKKQSTWVNHYNFARENKEKVGIDKIYKIIIMLQKINEELLGIKPSMTPTQELSISFGFSPQEIEDLLNRMD